MYYELSKKEKKIARVCIDKGLDAAFKEGLEKGEAVISDWQEGKFSSNREAYHKLYKVITDIDEAIAKRYDGLSGSRYLITVAQLFSDKIITEEDIKDFSDDTKAVIDSLAK
ncbi:MAG TPA: hypothetical protein VKB95_13260 [Chitinophagaceae bacterium]|nr:hypothetical protein [Chitinophagaceae bacterium]